MNFDSSAAAIGFLAFRRSITARTDGWNFDCSSARFFSSGESLLPISGSSIIARIANGGGVADALPAPAPPAPPAPDPPPIPPATTPLRAGAFALTVPDEVTVTVCATIAIALKEA